MPLFVKQVLETKNGDFLPLYFEEKYTDEEFLRFFEFCYSEKVLSPITGTQAENITKICL